MRYLPSCCFFCLLYFSFDFMLFFFFKYKTYFQFKRRVLFALVPAVCIIFDSEGVPLKRVSNRREKRGFRSSARNGWGMSRELHHEPYPKVSS